MSGDKLMLEEARLFAGYRVGELCGWGNTLDTTNWEKLECVRRSYPMRADVARNGHCRKLGKGPKMGASVFEGELTHTTRAYTDSVDFGRNTVNYLCGGGNLVAPCNLNQLRVDLSGSGFMSITQLVGLTQYMSEAIARGVPKKLIRPSDRISGYVTRMNLYRLIGIGMEEGFHRHDPGGNFVPMIRLDRDSQHDFAVDLVRDVIISHLANGAWRPGSILDVSLSEIMGNIPVHSRSLSDGIVGAQYYPAKEIVEICVADSGQGIVASMGSNTDYRGMTPEQMMRCALEEGFGEYYGAEAFSGIHTSGGMGLTYPTRLTRALGGKMWVVSQDQSLEVSSEGIVSFDGLFYPGTLISMRLPVEATATVYASDIITGAPHVAAEWTASEGWVDERGDQIDVCGAMGSDSVLW